MIVAGNIPKKLVPRVVAQIASILCHGCGERRWNDGTRCQTCGRYPKAVEDRLLEEARAINAKRGPYDDPIL